MLTFLHAADIHLDSPLRGLSHYEGAPPIEEIRGATKQALDNLVNFALEEKGNFVLVAGDLYDGRILIQDYTLPIRCAILEKPESVSL